MSFSLSFFSSLEPCIDESCTIKSWTSVAKSEVSPQNFDTFFYCFIIIIILLNNINLQTQVGNNNGNMEIDTNNM